MNRNDQVVNRVLERIKGEFPDDIDLVVGYGSYVNGTANEKSDVDMYFIPRNDRGYALGETFILQGIGYDLFGIPWQRLEAVAQFEDSITPFVGDGKVLYSRGQQAVDRYNGLKARLIKNLGDASHMHACACERVRTMAGMYRGIAKDAPIDQLRIGAGYVLMDLSEAVAYSNHTYFRKGLKTQYADLQTFERLPEDFVQLYHDIIIENDVHEIRRKCDRMIRNTMAFLCMEDIPAAEASQQRANQPQESADYDYAARWYEEASSTFNKIEVCADSQNYILAFISACCLQQSLEQESGIPLEKTDLLSAFQYDDLGKLLGKAREIERSCVAVIEANGGKIRRVESISEL